MAECSESDVARVAERGKRHNSYHYFKTIFLFQEPLSPFTKKTIYNTKFQLINNNSAPNNFLTIKKSLVFLQWCRVMNALQEIPMWSIPVSVLTQLHPQLNCCFLGDYFIIISLTSRAIIAYFFVTDYIFFLVPGIFLHSTPVMVSS